MTRLVLGTRGSKLALAQSEMMAAALRAAHPGLTVDLQIIVTKGDRVLDVALSAVGDKGLFVKELEQALLSHAVDLCVHSCKDLPSQIPDGLALAAFPERADARDILVMPDKAKGEGQEGEGSAPLPFTFDLLPSNARVGTSSLRRASQLRAIRPDLELRDVRGNVDTRLRKLAEGQYDALILAAAGLDRLGLTAGVADGAAFAAVDDQFVAWRIPPATMLPAVAQGILAIECRADDAETRRLLAALDHAPTRAAALAERAFLRRLEGGCQVPIAAYAEGKRQKVEGKTFADEGAPYELHLSGLIASLDGGTIVCGERGGDPDEAEAIGAALAEDLLAQGGEEILAAIAGVSDSG